MLKRAPWTLLSSLVVICLLLGGAFQVSAEQVRSVDLDQHLAQPRKSAKLEIARLRVLGAVKTENARAVLEKALPQLTDCFDEAAKNGAWSAKTGLRFLVFPNGHVSSIVVTHPTAPWHETLRKCLVSRSRDLRFPPCRGGHFVVEVTLHDKAPAPPTLLGVRRR